MHLPLLYLTRRSVLISNKSCNHVDFDIDLLGDCDIVVTELCRRAGWDLKHEMVSNGPIDVQLEEGSESRFAIKVVNPRASEA